MAKLFRRINPFLFFLSYLGFSNLVFAPDCATRASNGHNALLHVILDKPGNDPMKWCPLWAAVCNFVYRTCPTDTCEFTNYDTTITTLYDPSLTTNYVDFLHCTSCDVETSIDMSEYGVMVPKITTSSSELSSASKPSSAGQGDMRANNSSASSATATITALLVIAGIAGSVIAAKTSATHAGLLPASPGGDGATLANPKTGSGNRQSTIDAVTLLLHFQSVSTSGLLSISYPTIYRFFTYNFAWANLIIASDAFKDAVRSIGPNSSCLRDLGSLNPALAVDPYSATGMTVLGTRYNLDRATIGGLVYLTAIIGIAVSLAMFFLISVLLHALNAMYKPGKLQAYIDIWPSKASSMTLRLFLWVLGSIATFAIYQFAEPCSSASLIAFASIEFALILVTLLVVSVSIIKIAKAQGPEALYDSSESEESVYSRRWGSLYGLLKPAFYWFFIPDYVWVLVKSIIVGAGQGSGLGQVFALIGVELAILLALLSKRPYSTSPANAFHIFSTCKRLVASATLLVFWGAFNANTKRIIGIILLTVESTYAIVLFVILLLDGGARIAKWNTERKERRRASDNEATKTTNPLVPPMHRTDSDFSNTSPMHEKLN